MDASTSAVFDPTATVDGTFKVAHRVLDSRACVVAVEGELDLATAPVLKTALAELHDQGRRQFVLDLSGVAHLDSTGLSVLIGFQKRLNQDGELALAAPAPNVLALFDLVGISACFAVFDSVDEAVADVQGSAAGSAGSALTADAAMAIGLAGTALPFAGSPAGEAERWLRILCRFGDSARALSCGTGELSALDAGGSADDDSLGGAGRDCSETLARVIERAALHAGRRHQGRIGTADVLVAVIDEYGADFDRALAAAGIEKQLVTERLAAAAESEGPGSAD